MTAHARVNLRGFDFQGYLDDRIGVQQTADGGSGRELVADCPFCSGSSKLWVNSSTGLWICYKCGENGDPVRLVAQIDGTSRGAALQWIRLEISDAPSSSLQVLLDRRDDLNDRLAPLQADRPDAIAANQVELPDGYVPVWDPADRQWHVPAYLRQRGIRLRTAAAYGIGYCLTGRYANRLIMPVTMDGRLMTFQARTMLPDVLPKYDSPPVDKAGSLYGYDQAAMASTVVLVEGPTDVIGVVQAGFPAIGLTGKMCSSAQYQAIKRARFDRVIVMLDPDAEGYDGRLALDLAPAVETLIARLPDGFDPGSAPREMLADAIGKARAPRWTDRRKMPDWLRDRLTARSA